MDLESDFSVFHGIRDPYEELSGPQYFAFAWRMKDYKGAIRGWLETEAEKTRPKSHEELQQKARSGTASEIELKELHWRKRIGGSQTQH